MTPSRGQLYAVLDPARDASIWPTLRRLAPDFLCMMDGQDDEALRQALPHLMPIPEPGELLSWWRGSGGGKAWGIAMRSGLDLMALRRHLKKFMFAYLPASERVLFRFWDPRVLTAYMPLCDDEARRAFTGPMTALYAEDWKTGESLTLPLQPDPARTARPSRFVRHDAEQVDRLTCTSFILATYETLSALEMRTPFLDVLRSHRADLLTFWESLWPRVSALPPQTAAPALAFAAALRLRA